MLETHPTTDLGCDHQHAAVLVASPQEIALYEIGRQLAHLVARIDRVAGFFQHLGIDVGRQDFEGAFVAQRFGQ
ncbi:hypothetical protein SDC9_150231 [bioreactor metagenome]|uniref:Uncharacterized protein n=1 Tax=bioreactor metagenome TaxID=1076179 RepID=A0A645ELW6_9ZZZZ